MALVSTNCTNCSASIEVDESKESGICGHCGSSFLIEKKVSYTTNIVNNIQQSSAEPIYTPVIVDRPVVQKKQAGWSGACCLAIIIAIITIFALGGILITIILLSGILYFPSATIMPNIFYIPI